MEREPIRSSNLESVGYDPGTRTLEVVFRTGKQAGRVYQYAGVPPQIVAALWAAPSAGRYFAHQIRPHYPAQAVSVVGRPAQGGA